MESAVVELGGTVSWRRDGEEHCGGEGKYSFERAEHEMRVYGRNGLVEANSCQGRCGPERLSR